MDRGRLTMPPPTQVLKTAKTAALTVSPWLSLVIKSTIDPLIAALFPCFTLPLTNSSVSSFTELESVALNYSLVSSFDILIIN